MTDKYLNIPNTKQILIYPNIKLIRTMKKTKNKDFSEDSSMFQNMTRA